MLPIRTVLCPTDFSGPSEHAFRVACALARDYGARVLALHVLERPLMTYSGVMGAPPAEPPSAEERRAARERLNHAEAKDPRVSVEHLLEEGDPATAILQIATERGCELVVMGSHGRTGLARLLMGSIAEKVFREAPCPVLTVKIPARMSPAPVELATAAAAGN